jgi:hypothetical protein
MTKTTSGLTGLFESGKRGKKLFKSAFGDTTTVYRCSDACSEWLHSQCPRRVRMDLLDIVVVCDCPCHQKKRGGRGRCAAATESLELRPTNQSRNMTSTESGSIRFSFNHTQQPGVSQAEVASK